MRVEIRIPVYAEGDLTPKAIDTIKNIAKDRFPDDNIRFHVYGSLDKNVLVLGKVTEPGAILSDVRKVFTYSVAQIMTKANAATVLEAAIRQLIAKPEKPPFDNVHWSVYPDVIFNLLDFDKPTAIDIETSGNLGVTHTPEEVGLLSIAFYQEGKPPMVIVASDQLTQIDGIKLEIIADELPKFTNAIYHNGKFDVRVLNRVLGLKLCVWADTMLMHHTLNQAAGAHGLKQLAQLYLGAPDWEEDIHKYTKGGGHYEDIPRSLLINYNGWDVYWTYKLWELFSPQIEADEDAQKAYYFEGQVAEFLLKVEQRGIPFDKGYARELSEGLEVDAVIYREDLRRIVGENDFNPGSTQQVKRVLAEAFGIITGTTKEDKINEIKSNAVKGTELYNFCTNLLLYRKAVKMRGTYAEGWAKHERNGRVHPTFLVHGTSTGRLSSTGPNAQNVPREKRIRRMVAV